MKHPIYGKSATGERLVRIKQSPNFRNGQFQNLHYTPTLTEGYNYFNVLYQFLANREKRRRPVDIIPSVKTDLFQLNRNENILVWFGHSSYYIQLDGKRLLIDPVFSGNASPLRGTNKSFRGSDVYTADDIPEPHILFITHDHYDHLDYQTLIQLRKKVSKIFCGLGVGAHLEFWGYDPSIITEFDWGDCAEYAGFGIHATPGRHFSGRGITRNKTIWLSFVLESENMKLFLGGDSGYDTHFKEIGDKFGPFDLAMLEAGQYDVRWRYIHLHPEELLTAAYDLKAKSVFPVHNSKFMMSNHAWDDPLRKITALNTENFPVITPMIGEVVSLDNLNKSFTQWWEKIR